MSRLPRVLARRWLRVPCLGVLCACVLFAGCATFEDRLSAMDSPAEIAQATADYLVRVVGDESCAVAIATREGNVFCGAAGHANEHSLFRIASLTKFFVEESFLRLHAAGRLDLDRPVTCYSKMDLPPECARVTLRDLLRNRSGLPREFLHPWNPVDMFTALRSALVGSHVYAGFDSRGDFARELGHDSWRKGLGATGEVYSNVGYGLAGTVAEDALGVDLETILKSELLKSLGSADTTFVPRGTQTNRLTRACAGALPFLVRHGQDVPDHRLGDALRGAGGLFSSSADCIHFFVSLWPRVDDALRGRPVESCREGESRGLLCVKVLPSGRRVLYRAGVIYGGASFVCFDPRARTVVVALRNATSWPDPCLFEVVEALAAREQVVTSRALDRSHSKSQCFDIEQQEKS